MTRLIRCDLTVPEPITAVGLMVWVYRDQKAVALSGKDLVVPGARKKKDAPPRPACSRDGCATLERYGRLGAIIPTTGHRQRPALHPDAEAVHDWVVALSAEDLFAAMLLVRHGKSGAPPDADDLIPAPEPVRRLRGRREEIVEDATLPAESHLEETEAGTWVEIPHSFCPVRYWPTLESVEESRVEYRAWVAALRLFTRRPPPLRRWRLTGVGVSKAPWTWHPAEE